MTFAAVISDLDGVLVDSVAPTVRVWRARGERHGLDGAALQAANHGRPARAVLADHVSGARLDAEAEWLARAETTDTDGVIAYPGAAELLALPPGRIAIGTSAAARSPAPGSPRPNCRSPACW